MRVVLLLFIFKNDVKILPKNLNSVHVLWFDYSIKLIEIAEALNGDGMYQISRIIIRNVMTRFMIRILQSCNTENAFSGGIKRAQVILQEPITR